MWRSSCRAWWNRAPDPPTPSGCSSSRGSGPAKLFARGTVTAEENISTNQYGTGTDLKLVSSMKSKIILEKHIFPIGNGAEVGTMQVVQLMEISPFNLEGKLEMKKEKRKNMKEKKKE